MTRALLSLSLLLGCGQSADTPTDAEVEVDAFIGCAPPTMRWGACDDLLEIRLAGQWAIPEGPEPGIATVASIEPTGGGTGNTTVFLTADGTHRIELPAAPALDVGDTVSVTWDDFGFFLFRDDVFVAYVGTSAGEETRSTFAAAADGESQPLTLGGVPFALEGRCAGAYDRNDPCAVDVGVVAYGLAFEGETLGLGKHTLTVEGTERVIDVRRILARDDRYASQCETCADLWTRLVDVAIVAPAP